MSAANTLFVAADSEEYDEGGVALIASFVVFTA